MKNFSLFLTSALSLGVITLVWAGNFDEVEAIKPTTVENLTAITKYAEISTEDSIVISDSAKKKYTEELLAAYEWAFENGITTINDADKARLSDGLTRAELAKMMSQYITKVLGKAPVKTEKVEYADVNESLGDLADYIQTAYAYKIMGINADGSPLKNFNPNGKVTRAEYATVFSRVLYGDKYNKTGGKYYEDHIKALKEPKILTKDEPSIKEVRGWVMLMMYRSVNVKAGTTTDELTDDTTDKLTGTTTGKLTDDTTDKLTETTTDELTDTISLNICPKGYKYGKYTNTIKGYANINYPPNRNMENYQQNFENWKKGLKDKEAEEFTFGPIEGCIPENGELEKCTESDNYDYVFCTINMIPLKNECPKGYSFLKAGVAGPYDLCQGSDDKIIDSKGYIHTYQIPLQDDCEFFIQEGILPADGHCDGRIVNECPKGYKYGKYTNTIKGYANINYPPNRNMENYQQNFENWKKGLKDKEAEEFTFGPIEGCIPENGELEKCTESDNYDYVFCTINMIPLKNECPKGYRFLKAGVAGPYDLCQLSDDKIIDSKGYIHTYQIPLQD